MNIPISPPPWVIGSSGVAPLTPPLTPQCKNNNQRATNQNKEQYFQKYRTTIATHYLPHAYTNTHLLKGISLHASSLALSKPQIQCTYIHSAMKVLVCLSLLYAPLLCCILCGYDASSYLKLRLIDSTTNKHLAVRHGRRQRPYVYFA